MTRARKKPNADETADDRRKREVAEIFLEQGSQMAVALHEWPKGYDMRNGLDTVELMFAMEAKIKTFMDGDLRPVEEMLYGQALALQGIFTSLSLRAATQTSLSHYQAHLTLALKAQAQCRATLSALAEVRNPRQVAFVRQANIANGPQQVNNAARTPARARAGEVEAQQTELLEHRDAEWLDAGTASSSSTGYPALETMGAIDGATIPGGQSDFVAQRRQRRRMASDTRHA